MIKVITKILNNYIQKDERSYNVKKNPTLDYIHQNEIQ